MQQKIDDLNEKSINLNKENDVLKNDIKVIRSQLEKD